VSVFLGRTRTISRCRAQNGIKITRSYEVSSEQVGTLNKGEVIEAVETRKKDGMTRVQFRKPGSQCVHSVPPTSLLLLLLAVLTWRRFYMYVCTRSQLASVGECQVGGQVHDIARWLDGELKLIELVRVAFAPYMYRQGLLSFLTPRECIHVEP
jgi:hypothetical protein